MTLYGLGLAEVLTVVFIALKLTGVIGWSWLWVLSPVLITWSLALGIFLAIWVLD